MRTLRLPTPHWHVYKNSSESPEFPWFVDHCAGGCVDHLLTVGELEHFEEDHEYGSFASFLEAIAATSRWSLKECCAWSG